MIKSLRTYYLDALGISQYSLKRKLPPYSAETPSSTVFSNSLGEKITVRSSSDIGSAVAETTKSSHNNLQLDGALNQKPIGIINSFTPQYIQTYVKRQKIIPPFFFFGWCFFINNINTLIN